MSQFAPRLDVLPAPQRGIWPLLAAVPTDFVLYGGTAIALHLGHRQSVDFDFFSAVPFEPEALQNALPLAASAEVLQKHRNTLSVRTVGVDEVKLSFFGGLHLAQMDPPGRCQDNHLLVAGLRDLLATKLNTVYQRSEAKDYLDIHALLQAGLALAEGLACARAVYGPGFNLLLPLKALTYFEDGDLPTLSLEIKQSLVASVRRVREIPEMKPVADRICGD